MAFVLQYGYHKAAVEEECDSLRDALAMAFTLASSGDGYAERITGPDGTVIWQDEGPIRHTKSLHECATRHGIALPDYCA